MSEEEIARKYVTWAADMRMRGVHPDWIYVWLGANTLDGMFFEWVQSPDCHWPVNVHMQKPEEEARLHDYYRCGLPKWQEMLKRLEQQ